jgi:hypothetical protein
MSISNISFKNTGYEQADVFNYNLNSTSYVQEFPIGIKLPLRRGSKSGETIFAMNFDVERQIKDNLKFLLTCRKNEVLMKPNYGTNLSSLFNSTNLDEQDLNNLVREEISSSVDSYANPMNIGGKNYFINLSSYWIKEDFNDMQKSFYSVEIEYTIAGYSRRDIEIIKKINNTENDDYLMSKLNKIIIKFRTSN